MITCNLYIELHDYEFILILNSYHYGACYHEIHTFGVHQVILFTLIFFHDFMFSFYIIGV